MKARRGGAPAKHPRQAVLATRRSGGAHLRALLNSYSEILFLRQPWFGAALLMVTLLDPNVGAAGLVAVIVAYACARFLGFRAAFLASGFYTYNALLVGLSIGHLFRLTPLTLFFVAATAVLTLVTTHALQHAFAIHLRLPVLSLPFVLVSSLAYLAASRYANLYAEALYPHGADLLGLTLPAWLAGYLQSLGAILFVPDVRAGAVLALGLLLLSPILALLSLLGYGSGVAILAALGGSFAAAFANPNAFNFSLIAMAIGGVFLVPSPRAYLLALIGVVIATPLLSATEVFWSLYGLPAFALPFNVVALTLVYVLGLVEFPLVARGLAVTPEGRLDEFLAARGRFPGSWRSLALPFSGRWLVWQGSHGPWTHRGPWAHAIDFLIRDAEGNTHREDGGRLEHYHAFRKPVLAPVRGRVVRVVRHLPDNPPGLTNTEEKWGNLVVLADERGFFVELSHFAQESIRVAPGTWVERGALLGLCGNSGNSPQPHIHLQVQGSDRVGAATLPCSFVAYLEEDRRFQVNALPEAGALVESVVADPELERRFSFVLDDRLQYRVFERGEEARRLTLRVRMADDGTFYFDSGRGQLYFGRFEQCFLCYRVAGGDPDLRRLFVALPRLPLVRRGAQPPHWDDRLPLQALAGRWRSLFYGLPRSLYHGWGEVAAEAAFSGEWEVRGRVRVGAERVGPARRPGWREAESVVTIDPRGGIGSVRMGDWRLERI
jgi:urea transporter